MTRIFRTFLIALLAFAAAIPLASGQARTAYSRAEIDQMLAPIALYPDPLLSQLLMAATFPEDVTEAARWSRAHPGVEGDAAVRMVQEYEWDPSVKSLVAFPRVLARMEENPDWTRRLGDAFIVQEPVVMEAIQDLRRRAQDNGQLASDDRMRVVDQPGSIAIEPANPQYIYVPYYDPMVAYGSWWWPAYPPYYWAPWPGYVAYGPGFWWGAPVGLSVGFFFGGFDWYHRHPYVRSVGNYYVRPSWVGRNAAVTPGRWQQNYWGGRGGGSYARAYNPVTRPQFHSPMPVRDAPRSFTQQPRVQAAPQQQFAPRQPQSSAPRVDSQQRFEARQNWQARQAAPEWRRSAEQRAQAPVLQRQAAAPQIAPRQQAAPQQFAPRFERREMRTEQRQQRFSAPHADRGGGEHSRGGGHRFN